MIIRDFDGDEIRVFDKVLAPVIHAVQVDDDWWLWAAPGSGGICHGPGRVLVSTLAGVVEPFGRITRAHSGRPDLDMNLDGCRNAWVEERYLGPDRYLPAVVYPVRNEEPARG